MRVWDNKGQDLRPNNKEYLKESSGDRGFFFCELRWGLKWDYKKDSLKNTSIIKKADNKYYS